MKLVLEITEESLGGSTWKRITKRRVFLGRCFTTYSVIFRFKNNGEITAELMTNKKLPTKVRDARVTKGFETRMKIGDTLIMHRDTSKGQRRISIKALEIINE